jgi:hypothetical protein
MLENDNIVGSDSALAEEQVTNNQNSSNDSKVNPGAIRKGTTQGILNALSSASGKDFNSVEDAVEFIARMQSRQTRDDNVQSVESKSEPVKSTSADENDLREQFAKLQRDLQQKERALMQKDIDSQIMQSMGDRFDQDLMDYALQKVKSNIKLKNDGTYAIINQKGQERYGMDGAPLSLKDLIDEVAQGNPKLLKQNSISGGSGLRPGQGNFAGAPVDQVPDYSRDPAAFNAWAQSRGLGKGAGLKSAQVTASTSTQSKKII